VVGLQVDLFHVRAWPLQLQHAGLGAVVEILTQPEGHVSLSRTLVLDVGLLSSL
jgi:hypothetical protein